MLKCLKTIRSYTGHARWLAEIDETEPEKYLARVQVEDIPSPYRYSPSVLIMKWKGLSVVCFETSHKVYQVFEVPPELLRFSTDDEATDWHSRFSKCRHEIEWTSIGQGYCHKCLSEWPSA